MSPKDTMRAAVEAMAKARHWHNGDVWRESTDSKEREAWEAHRDVLDSALSLLRSAIDQGEPTLTDERILHLWDTHVAYETGYKGAHLGNKDKLAFARAVLAASSIAAPKEEPVAWVDGAALRWLADPDRGQDAYIETTLNNSNPDGVRTPLYTRPIAADTQGDAKDAAWVKRIRETAHHLRENSLSLAKYPGMADEARARELAALYIEEIAALQEFKQALNEPKESSNG